MKYSEITDKDLVCIRETVKAVLNRKGISVDGIYVVGGFLFDRPSRDLDIVVISLDRQETISSLSQRRDKKEKVFHIWLGELIRRILKLDARINLCIYNSFYTMENEQITDKGFEAPSLNLDTMELNGEAHDVLSKSTLYWDNDKFIVSETKY